MIAKKYKNISSFDVMFLYLQSNDDIMIIRRDVFQAIAYLTRRAILLLLTAQTMTAGAIASIPNRGYNGRARASGRGGETADAVDSKSTVGNHMGVQVPPSAPLYPSL